MATDVAVVDIEQERDRKRGQALLKAIGLDKVPPEQREIALAIAKRYELDLLLKHLVLVDGRPYITRDGLLHVAHRSGVLDGIEVTDAEVVTIPDVGAFWRASCSVYRKDMSRPFTYSGRYPTKGGNQRYAPEMAVKVAEVMALRRAFDVSAPVMEERWDVDPSSVVAVEPEPPLAETVAARKAAITSGPTPVGSGQGNGEAVAEPPPSDEPPHPAAPDAGRGTPASRRTAAQASPRGAVQAPDSPEVGGPAPDAAPSTTGAANQDGDADSNERTEAADPARRCEAFAEAVGRCERDYGHAGEHALGTESWR